MNGCMSRKLDLTGQKFGRLTVLKAAPKKGASPRWECRCDCGKSKNTSTMQLRSGKTRSCGCLRRETTAARTRLDLTGQRFGKLVALKRAEKVGTSWGWLCQCDCGNTHVVPAGSLTSEHVKSCGCLRHEPNAIDITGQRFGRLTVLARHGRRGSAAAWRCRCDCGNETVVVSHAVRTGNARSCGCLRAEQVGGRARTHGKSKTPEYQSWLGMRARCHNPTHKKFPRYGGRGIVVCERWRDSFENFIEDMGPKPGRGYSIDRIDNDGPYSPENCRWATGKEQARNTPRTRTVLGEPLMDVCERLGIKPATIRRRLDDGWSEHEAVYGR